MHPPDLPQATGTSLADTLRRDLPASFVVFLVALPLCLGIAHASGAPPLAGLVTGIVGGCVVAFLSGSSLAVSGPAAGLVVLTLDAIDRHGYAGFAAVVLGAGVLQLLLAAFRAGRLTKLVPHSVVSGLLSSIGAVILLKQIPHAVGWDHDYEGDFEFFQPDGETTVTELGGALANIHVGAAAIAIATLATLVVARRIKWLTQVRWLPGALLAVLVGVGLHEAVRAFAPAFRLGEEARVSLPPLDSITAAFTTLPRPDFGVFRTPQAWVTTLVFAAVASLETLLCVEAVDMLDPFRRRTPPSRELAAQGVGNLLCGAFGALPMTAVIVRGSANIRAGARSRYSAAFHGVWLLVAALAFSQTLGMIPLAVLAAILIDVGFHLCEPKKMIDALRKPYREAVPFAATFVAILLTDILIGSAVGLAVHGLLGMYARWSGRARHADVASTPRPGAEAEASEAE